MYRIADIFLISGSVPLGRQYVGADGKAHEHIDQKVDQCTGGAHGCQCVGSGKAPHHNNIRRIKKQLQHAGKHQRKSKNQDFPQQRTIAHIHFI